MILTITIIYLVSFLGSWYGTRNFLIKFRFERAGISDVIFVILPLINTCTLFYYWEFLEFKLNTGWFFGLKKVNK